ncbi:hypothetical protein ACHQM5_018330 [Ranunculus cassubicifolius]
MSLTVFERLVIHFLLSSSFFPLIYAIDGDVTTANVSTLWTNNDSHLERSYSFVDNSFLRFVLFNNSDSASGSPGIGCGFFANGTLNEFYFAVFAIGVLSIEDVTKETIPRVLWTANRDKPVSNNATLELKSEGDLVLKDVDNSLVWSTNTSGDSVAGMRINGSGNLVLYMMHTTRLLVASVSSSNRSAGPLFISVVETGLHAFVESDPSQYYGEVAYLDFGSKSASFATVRIDFLKERSKRSAVFYSLGTSNKLQYIRLDSDGHFRVYNFSNGIEQVVMELLVLGNSPRELDECDYPTVYGRYGICSSRQCSCPMARNRDANYFTPLNSTSPSLGCVPITPLSCANSQLHLLVELYDVEYFGYDLVYDYVTVEGCRQACLRNCSCKAALFRFNTEINDSSRGDCSLPSDIFSLIGNGGNSDVYSTFIKVQRSSLAPSPSRSPIQSTEGEVPINSSTKRSTDSLPRILVPILSVIFLLAIVLSFLLSRLCKNDVERDEENDENEGIYSIDQVSGMPRRFSYIDLESATGNFQKRLGGGGFGSVFEGNFADGTKVAEFVAEVKTIGSIHHVNLVRLVGFCAENSHKLLVYDYMCNGSLDKWIFHPKQQSILSWETRRKIILDIARGLTYLHEKCRNKIVHMDIKPENILLDEDFNAKVSDFGLARFIERDENQVITTMRGTRGYLAPEWLLNRKISEKVDVYSFGIVVLEIMCGRRNLDYSQDDETEFLLHIVRRKADEDRLFEAVDKQCVDMLQHRDEAVKMIRTAIWCLQGVSTRRLTMSMVVKVLESGVDLEIISDYSFLTS